MVAPSEAQRIIEGIEHQFEKLPVSARLAARTAAPAQIYAAVGSGADAVQAPPPAHLCRSRTNGGSAFFYNAIFFTYALILTDFYGVRSEHVGYYLLPFAAGNFLGPVLIGRLFDTQGRRPMIAFTYIVSGLLLAVTGFLFARDLITAQTQTLCWMTVFFFASAAASSAYLTVSETFPLEIRALAIALFYAVGTGIGGIIGPWLFGVLIDTGSRVSVFGGYLVGSLLMVLGGAVAWRWGVAAERKPLEMVARPLTFIDID